ncbi:MAG: hypothetical protein F4Z28_14400 [Gammaproteobacteria bacterium]|nr:hypothetical protein [Gammaproteobacteria bacterium]
MLDGTERAVGGDDGISESREGVVAGDTGGFETNHRDDLCIARVGDLVRPVLNDEVAVGEKDRGSPSCHPDPGRVDE